MLVVSISFNFYNRNKLHLTIIEAPVLLGTLEASEIVTSII